MFLNGVSIGRTVNLFMNTQKKRGWCYRYGRGCPRCGQQEGGFLWGSPKTTDVRETHSR